MKRVCFLVLVLCCLAHAATVYRIDPVPVMTVSGTVPAGSYPHLLAVPGATIGVFTDSAGTIPATAYTDSTGNTACPVNAPVVIAGTATCSATSGQQGQFGFWLVAGTYYYRVTLPSGTGFGPYPLSVPAAASTIPSATDQLQYLRTQPNTGNNATLQFSALPTLAATDYQFMLNPSGTLTGGVANSVTLAPVPRGVNATDVGHYLFIPSCSGGSQTVLITGGTAVSGATSGTITFTPTSSCNAGWTIESATAGIQEAVEAAVAGQVITLPSGVTSSIFGTATVNKAVRLTCGTGSVTAASGCVLEPQTAGVTVFHVLNVVGAQFDHFAVYYGSAQASGRTFDLDGDTDTVIQYVGFLNEWDSIYMTASSQALIDHCNFGQFQDIAITVQYPALPDATGPTITNNSFFSPSTAAAAIKHLSTGGVVIANNQIHANAAKGVWSTAGGSSQVSVTGNLFDGQTSAGILINPASDNSGYQITGNFISNFSSNSYACVEVLSTHAILGVISGNTCAPWYTTGAASGITAMVVNGTNWTISSNTIEHTYTGIQVSSGVNVTLGPNQITDVGSTPWFGGGTNVLLNRPFPMTYAQMTAYTVANGSQVYATDSNSTCTAGSSTGRTCSQENGAWTH